MSTGIDAPTGAKRQKNLDLSAISQARNRVSCAFVLPPPGSLPVRKSLIQALLPEELRHGRATMSRTWVIQNRSRERVPALRLDRLEDQALGLACPTGRAAARCRGSPGRKAPFPGSGSARGGCSTSRAARSGSAPKWSPRLVCVSLDQPDELELKRRPRGRAARRFARSSSSGFVIVPRLSSEPCGSPAGRSPVWLRYHVRRIRRAEAPCTRTPRSPRMSP